MIETRRAFLVLAAGGLAAGSRVSRARSQTAMPDSSTIVLLRHADRMRGSGDTELSSAGKKRA